MSERCGYPGCGELWQNRVHHDSRLNAYHPARLSATPSEDGPAAVAAVVTEADTVPPQPTPPTERVEHTPECGGRLVCCSCHLFHPTPPTDEALRALVEEFDEAAREAHALACGYPGSAPELRFCTTPRCQKRRREVARLALVLAAAHPAPEPVTDEALRALETVKASLQREVDAQRATDNAPYYANGVVYALIVIDKYLTPAIIAAARPAPVIRPEGTGDAGLDVEVGKFRAALIADLRRFDYDHKRCTCGPRVSERHEPAADSMERRIVALERKVSALIKLLEAAK